MLENSRLRGCQPSPCRHCLPISHFRKYLRKLSQHSRKIFTQLFSKLHRNSRTVQCSVTMFDCHWSFIKHYRIDVKFRYGRRFRRALVGLGHMLGMRERNYGHQQEYDAVLHDVIELMFRLCKRGSFLLVLNSHVICSVNIDSIDMQLAG